MVFRYCLGITMSVSTLMIFSGAATPSSVVNLSMTALLGWNGRNRSGGGLSRMPPALKGKLADAMPSRGNGDGPPDTPLARTGLDRFHIAIGQAEMMADLVDQHVADDIAQRVLVFGQIIQDRPAVQPDHIRQPRDVLIAAKRQADALKQAEQVELALRFHVLQHLIGRKIVDADDHALA